MHLDLLLDPEIVRLNQQHKWTLENHETSINLMKQEMLQHQEAWQARDGEILEFKAMGQTLLGQVKGKEKASDLTPEASEEGGGSTLPPRGRRVARAPGWGGDPDDEGEGSGRKPGESKKGRRDKRPAPQPEADDDAADKEQLATLSRIMTDAMGGRTRVPAERAALFRNEIIKT